MVFHMKTTLVIDDEVMVRLKEEAVRRRCTMSELVESALRRLLDERGQRSRGNSHRCQPSAAVGCSLT